MLQSFWVRFSIALIQFQCFELGQNCNALQIVNMRTVTCLNFAESVLGWLVLLNNV